MAVDGHIGQKVNDDVKVNMILFLYLCDVFGENLGKLSRCGQQLREANDCLCFFFLGKVVGC